MFRRKGTKSRFSLFKQENRSQTKLPDPQPEKKNTEVKTDDVLESTKTENIDKNIEQDNERDTKADDKEGKRDKPSENVVKNNEALFTDSTKMKVGTESIFSLFWDKNLSSRLVPIEITKTAHFIPNGIALQELLLESTGIVGRSSWINKHERTYCEYAVAVGYFYLYYIQILRAKEAASDLDGYENSCLKRFLKMHPEESIPIAEPFFPYFSSIVSTQLEDRKYDWVIPSYGSFAGRNTFESRNNFDHCVEYIRPQIPYMLAILASFGATPKANLDDRIDDDGVFRPIDILNQNAVHVFNSDMRTNRNQAPPALSMVFYTCGTSYPFRFHNENQEDARKYMKSTCFYGPKGINFSCIANQNVDGALAETIDISRIDNFLIMNKEKNPRWFDYIKEQMKIFSKHWSTQYNLSQIPKTGGLESSIICRLHKDTINGNVYEYTDHLLNINDERTMDWYQNKFRNMTGSFKTTRAGILRPEELQALTFGINATPPITTATGHPEYFRQGQYFNHSEAADGATVAMELGSDDGSKGPIEMYAGWRSDVFQSIFRAEPSGQRG